MLKGTEPLGSQCHCILRPPDCLTYQLLADIHVGRHDIPKCVYLFLLDLCQSVKLRIEVLTQQFYQSYLIFELQT